MRVKPGSPRPALNLYSKAGAGGVARPSVPVPMDNKSGVAWELLPTHPQPQALPGPCSGVLGGPSCSLSMGAGVRAL